MKRALVTGASGFIGRRLCERLREAGVRVRALMRNPADGPWDEHIAADIGAPLPAGALAGVECVFHLAAKVHALEAPRADEREYERVNAGGTARLVEAAIETAVRRFVLLSSVKAMGEGGERCLDEGCTQTPETSYGASKLAAERAVLDASRRGAVEGVVLRLPLVYGPDAKGNLASMLDAVARRRFPPLEWLENKRSMVHVEDVARAALLAAEAPGVAGQVYIVTDGIAYSTQEIYREMCRALGRATPRWSVPMPLLRLAARAGDLVEALSRRRFAFDSDALEKLTGSAWYSSEKIREELGFRPRYSLEEALPEMVERFRDSRRARRSWRRA